MSYVMLGAQSGIHEITRQNKHLEWGVRLFMQELFKNSFGDFKRSYGKYLSFELMFSLLASGIFAPFLTYVFNRLLIIFRNSPALLNNEVLSFGFSFKGFVVLFLIGLFAVSILFVELGVIVIISHKSFFRKRIYISQAVNTAISKLPKLIGLGLFQLFFLLLLIFPWVDSTTMPTFIDLNLTIILTDFFNNSFAIMMTYIVAGIMFIYFFIRWVFALHFIFIQDKSVWNAMKASWKMTKRHKIRLIIYLIALNMTIFLIGVGIVTGVSYLSGIIESKTIGHFIGNYLLTFTSYFTLVMSLFLIPLNVIILTQLFHQFSLLSGEQLNDQLYLRESRLLGNFEKKIEAFIATKQSAVRLVIVLLLSLMFLINYITTESVVYLPWDVEVAAHRGDGYHSPENSMSGIKSSIAKGIDAIEIDVAMTKDGVVVLSHDEDLRRSSGRPERIKDLTYEELMEVDIGRLFDASFTGEKIPTLAEALDYITETETKIIIDVKVYEDEAEEYAQKIVDLVNEYEAEELSLVQSFNNKFLRAVRKHNPHITIGQILFLSVGNLSKLDVDFYTIRQTMLTERLIKQARKENRDIWVWTVNNPRNIKEVLKYNVDGIITDYPERVYQLIERK